MPTIFPTYFLGFNENILKSIRYDAADDAAVGTLSKCVKKRLKMR
jgi:hypothetical protein